MADTVFEKNFRAACEAIDRRDFGTAHKFLQNAEKRAAQRNDRANLARVYFESALICELRDEFMLAHHYGSIALSLNEEANNQLGVAQTRVQLGLIYLRAGQHKLARTELEQAAAIARALTNFKLLSICYARLSSAEILDGEALGAGQHAINGAAAAATVDYADGVGENVRNLCLVLKYCPPGIAQELRCQWLLSPARRGLAPELHQTLETAFRRRHRRVRSHDPR